MGDYTAALTDIIEQMFTNKKTQAEELVIVLVGTIVDGDLEHRAAIGRGCGIQAGLSEASFQTQHSGLTEQLGRRPQCRSGGL